MEVVRRLRLKTTQQLSDRKLSRTARFTIEATCAFIKIASSTPQNCICMLLEHIDILCCIFYGYAKIRVVSHLLKRKLKNKTRKAPAIK
jgi:hypothetical protein